MRQVMKFARRSRALLTTFAVVATVALSGCASVPMADHQADVRAKTFAPPTDGKANLYVYRNEVFGGAVKLTLVLDDKVIGDTGPNTYVLRQISPGKHTLVSKSENDAKLALDAKAGRNYFVWQEVKMGLFSPRTALHEVDAATGEKGVRECELIKSP